jgi:ABC-2 type transport system permease protein
VSALNIALTSIRRVGRDRRALFFLVVLPVVVILIIGFTVRGFSTFRVGVVDLGAGKAGRDLTAALGRAGDIVVLRYATTQDATRAVARGQISTAVVMPAGMDPALRAGRTTEIGVVAEQADTTQQAAARAVTAVIERQGAREQAAIFAADHSPLGFEDALERASSLQSGAPQVSVASRPVDTNADVLPEGFEYSAPTELVLFVFLTALTGGASVIDSRRLGIYERAAAAPVRPAAVVVGEALGFGAIAVMQSALIVLVGAVVFGVSWGNLPAAVVLVVVWALVGAGAGMLSGTLFRTPEQATAVGPIVGIAFAMLGGCMWPLSIVSTTMREIGHVTPHAWAVDAWTALLARHGTLATIGRQLAVLGTFAVGSLALATRRFSRLVAVR